MENASKDFTAAYKLEEEYVGHNKGESSTSSFSVPNE